MTYAHFQPPSELNAGSDPAAKASEAPQKKARRRTETVSGDTPPDEIPEPDPVTD